MSTQSLVRQGQQDIVREGAFDLTPHSLSEALTLAEMMSKSELVPQGFRGKPADILIAVQYGAEIGLKPLQALSGIAIINGRACVWGDALLSLVLDSGLMTNYKEMGFEEIEAAEKAVFWCTRKGQAEPIQREFSVADAKRAGLWNGKDTWKKYPWRMLQMRARAFALRDAFSDVLKGLSMREEIEDIETSEAPKVLAMPRRLSERTAEAPKAEEPKPVEPEAPTEPTTTINPPVCETCNVICELRPAGQKDDRKWEAYYRCPAYTKGSKHTVIKQAEWIERFNGREPGQD